MGVHKCIFSTHTLHQAQITVNSFNSYDNYRNTQWKDFAACPNSFAQCLMNCWMFYLPLQHSLGQPDHHSSCELLTVLARQQAEGDWERSLQCQLCLENGKENKCGMAQREFRALLLSFLQSGNIWSLLSTQGLKRNLRLNIIQVNSLMPAIIGCFVPTNSRRCLWIISQYRVKSNLQD